MTPPTFRGVPLTASPNLYVATVRGVPVRAWRVHLENEDGGAVGAGLWFASCDLGATIVGAGPGFATASLALRSLLTELGRVHSKLDKLLAPVRPRKPKRAKAGSETKGRVRK